MPRKHRKTVWLVGGGTGGHVVPLFAVAEQLKKDGIHLLYIGGGAKTLEADLARKYGIPFRTVPYGKLRRYVSFSSLILNCVDSVKMIAGFVKSIMLILELRPKVIFSKGGPVALPVATAAWVTRTPLITHESDANMGATNNITGMFATKIFTAFSAQYYPLHHATKIMPVGIPIRESFCRATNTTLSQPPTILVLGGSQGSLAINTLLVPILPQLTDRYNIVHITGKAWYKEFIALKHTLKPKHEYEVIDFTDDLARYVKKASLVISRSSSAIFEIASVGRPMLLIPLPGAAQDHQTRNAQIFVEHHAAVMVNQQSLTPEVLCEKIENILQDKTLSKQLRENTRIFNSCDAAEKIASYIKQFLD